MSMWKYNYSSTPSKSDDITSQMNKRDPNNKT